MPKSRILHATRDHAGYHFLVHLDPAMTVAAHEAHELSLPEGTPHPHFLRRYDWPNLTPGSQQRHDPKAVSEDNPNGLVDMTEAEYEAHIAEMIAQQAEMELQGIRFYQPAPQPYSLVKSLHGKELPLGRHR